MKHKLNSVLLALLLFSAVNYSDAQRDSIKGNEWNKWRELDPHARVAFVDGYFEGWHRALSLCNDRALSVFGGGSYTVGQVVDELDRFYRNPSNRHIPAYDAIEWVKWKLEGGSEQELDEALRSMRNKHSRP